MSVITIVALLVFLTIPEGMSVGEQMKPRCKCIMLEKQPIGRLIGMLEVNPSNSHCKNLEIIATLKKDGNKICLDPNAPWVKKVLDRKQAQQTP